MSKPRGKVNIEWSPEFAYAIGLIVTDGNLSKDGRHLSFISKDFDLIQTFKDCLGIKHPVVSKTSGYTEKDDSYWVQFGDVLFHRFLMDIGLMPNKSKQMNELSIPDEFFLDLTRGLFDGDGTFYSYWDPRWRSSFMFYTAFVSASIPFLKWLQRNINRLIGINGAIGTGNRIGYLRYAKRESEILIKSMYYSDEIPCLERKRLKIKKACAII
jgi:hypothetical protein